MLIGSILALCSLILGIVLAVARVRAAKPDPEPLYGHPWPPVPAVVKKLPKLPAGFTWELFVEHDDVGKPWLTVSLVSVASGQPVATHKADLVRKNMYSTYAETYTRYAIIKDVTFNNDLILPITTWALEECAKASAESTKGRGIEGYRMTQGGGR